jgi:fucose 4-O-acetylase-like acetyltransferase
MLAIVAGHVWVHGPGRPFIYSWHVPIFFVLSGYLWKPNRSLGHEIKNRVRSLLVPYASWLLVLGTIAASIEGPQGRFGPERLLHILWGGSFATGSPFWAMWFVTALFFAAVIYRLVSPLPLLAQWAIAVVLFVAAVYIPGHPLRFLPLSLGLALPGILFIVAGFTLQRFRGAIRRPAVTGLALLVASLAVISLHWSQPLDLKKLDVGTPVLSTLTALAISVGLILLAESALGGGPFRRIAPGDAGTRQNDPRAGMERMARVVTPLAQASLTVLFIHPAVITSLHRFEMPKAAVFLLTIGISWSLGLLLLRIPHSGALTGVKPAR